MICFMFSFRSESRLIRNVVCSPRHLIAWKTEIVSLAGDGRVVGAVVISQLTHEQAHRRKLIDIQPNHSGEYHDIPGGIILTSLCC